MVKLQIPPASEWKIVSSPMNTTTTDSTGALCNGCRIIRWMATPAKNEPSATSGNAIQKFRPHCIICQHT